jgi:hypothetical protein
MEFGFVIFLTNMSRGWLRLKRFKSLTLGCSFQNKGSQRNQIVEAQNSLANWHIHFFPHIRRSGYVPPSTHVTRIRLSEQSREN